MTTAPAITQDFSPILRTMPDVRVIEQNHEGQRIWVKQAVGSKSKAWHRVQAAFSKVIRNPMLRPTVLQCGRSGLREEAARIRRFYEAGFHVPQILDQCEQYIVLSDLGGTLERHLKNLRRDGKLEECKPLLLSAVRELARLHKAGLVHGRPHVKDLVYSADNGGRIGFLDLEEDPQAVMPFDCACSRDIWLLLCSSVPYLNDEGAYIETMFDAYQQESGMSPSPFLRKLLRALSPLCKLARTLERYMHVGKDVRNAAIVNERLLLMM